jgi:hypothetical protein
MDRIFRYRQAVYFLQMNRHDCSLFYELNTRLLKQCEAQLLPLIVGSTFYNDPISFYRYIDQDPVPNICFTVSGPKTGKSTTLAMALAALLSVLENNVVISLVGEMAPPLLMLTQRFYSQLPHHPTIIKMTCSTLVVEGFAKITTESNEIPLVIVIDEDEKLADANWLLDEKRLVICVSSPIENSPTSKIKANYKVLDYEGTAPWFEFDELQPFY